MSVDKNNQKYKKTSFYSDTTFDPIVILKILFISIQFSSVFTFRSTYQADKEEDDEAEGEEEEEKPVKA